MMLRLIQRVAISEVSGQALPHERPKSVFAYHQIVALSVEACEMFAPAQYDVISRRAVTQFLCLSVSAQGHRQHRFRQCAHGLPATRIGGPPTRRDRRGHRAERIGDQQLATVCTAFLTEHGRVFRNPGLLQTLQYCDDWLRERHVATC